LSGDLEGARAGYAAVRQLAREVGDREVEAFATINLGAVETNLGDFRAGLRHSTEAAELFRELGRESGFAAALGNCGWNALGLKEWALAEDSFRQALAILNRLGAKPRMATEAVGLAAALVAKREAERAARLLGAAAALRDELEIGLSDVFEEQSTSGRSPMRRRPSARRRSRQRGPEVTPCRRKRSRRSPKRSSVRFDAPRSRTIGPRRRFSAVPVHRARALHRTASDFSGCNVGDAVRWVATPASGSRTGAAT
jgi:hypothetical protein